MHDREEVDGERRPVKEVRVEIARTNRHSETERGGFVRSRLRVRQAEPDRLEPQDGAQGQDRQQSGAGCHGTTNRMSVVPTAACNAETPTTTAIASCESRSEQAQANGIW